MQTISTTPPKLYVTREDQASLMRVLCVEDDNDTCDVLRFVMTNYDFHAVGTIAAATELIDERPFDLYVLDNWLPDGSGIDLCKRIRETQDRAPIIFTSAIGQRRDIDQALEAGADRYLVKPYEPDTLLHTVKELLNPSGELAFKS
jgi:two-component system, OmpR family, response regulator RegX3